MHLDFLKLGWPPFLMEDLMRKFPEVREAAPLTGRRMASDLRDRWAVGVRRDQGSQ